MIKECTFYTSILLTVIFISSGFKANDSHKYYSLDEDYVCEYPSLNSYDYIKLNVPFLGKYFVGYKEAMACRESQGRYCKMNSLGYMGKYQFGQGTLEIIGIKDSMAFLANPRLQEKAFVTLLSRNKYILRHYISYFEGKMIDGVKITESGILAAAHLGGAGSVKKFLNTNGKRNCRDAYGTSIKVYLKKFAGYETSGIPAVKNAKVQ